MIVADKRHSERMLATDVPRPTPHATDRSVARSFTRDKMSTCKNVFEAILRYGHDEDFIPHEDNEFIPTDAPAGSPEKIEVLRRRVELGQPLWHGTDRVDYSGLTGAIRPRE